MNKNWSAVDHGQYVEVLPLNDTKEHLMGDECWCDTVTERIDGKAMIVHNSNDGREAYE